MKKQKADKIIEKLRSVYGDRRIGLDFRTPYELLVATILSAQCTDVRVNLVTPTLFAMADTPKAMQELGEARLREIIQTCGLSKTKAANIIRASQILAEEFHGEVPDTFDALISLPGVGRKTANVVLSNAFGVDAIAVDTHVFRVTNRLGLAHADHVLQTEMQLMEIIDQDLWSDAHHWLIWHGREICGARAPKCASCFLNELCEYPEKNLGISPEAN